MKTLIKKIIFLGIISICYFVPQARSVSTNSLDSLDYKTPIKNSKNRFVNYPGEDISKHILDSGSIFLKTQINISPYFSKPGIQKDWCMQSIPADKSENLIITWLGHSTFLIQINDINILTDPIFYDLSVLYPRKNLVGIKPENLPKKIDLVIISHNHRDHMDENSLKFLQKHSNPICLVPQGDAALVKRFGFTTVEELTWWQNYTNNKVIFTFLPAIHWSNRVGLDLNKSLWGSWMISFKKQNIYFCGDSAYGKHFEKIAAKYPQIDVALLPIGPNGPKDCISAHMTALESVNAFADLQANIFVPMHWGTFGLGTDVFDTALNFLDTGWQEKFSSNKNKHLKVLKFGQSLSI